MRKIFLLVMPLFLAALSFRAPSYFTITGKITNEGGQPLASVNITHKSSKISVVSNSDGAYSISVPEKTGSLVFSMIGYETKQLRIGSNSVMNVVLKTTTENLEEVVVVGYGTQRQMVELFYLQNKCYKEIVEETGIEWNAVRSFIQNGKRNLKICMDQQKLQSQFND